MSFIKSFSELNKHDASIAGGKGASLGELTQAGIPVPPGFVILAESFEKFLEGTDLNVEIDAILKTVEVDKMHTIEHASEKIQSLIINASMPQDILEKIIEQFEALDCEFVAVRSSATAEDSLEAAWAGQLESYLNTTKDDLLNNVRECWASLFTPRALFYRFEKGLHQTKVSVAVVVQKMIQSEVSGICFTVHPVTEDYNQMIIEAGYGLGEAIVGGMITPDTYVIDKLKTKNKKLKTAEKIIDKNISEQEMMIVRSENGNKEEKVDSAIKSEQKLSDENIIKLAELCKKIEEHYGKPQDIEWALEKEKLYIVQSRPITTLRDHDKVNDITDNSIKDPGKIILSKYYTREHSLFYASVWKEANCVENYKWLENNMERVMYIRPNKSDFIEVWYELAEIESFNQWIIENISSDHQWFTKVTDDFNYHWNKLYPYFKKSVALTLEELKDFYTHWVAWWTPMAITMQIPEIDSLSKETRDTAFKLRAETQEYSDKGDEIYFNCVEEAYPEMSEYYWVLTPEEVFAGIFSDEKELKKRKEGWVMFNDGLYDISDLKKEMKRKNFESEDVKELTEGINGATANGGCVTGRTVIVNSVEQLNKVEETDVLVTPMTDPRYVPVLKKVSAIVTDEGGITCHAAIVSRELNIPCVIGTKIATQVLKDGDMVEVDADKGIVRILGASNESLVDYLKSQKWFFGARANESLLLYSLFCLAATKNHNNYIEREYGISFAETLLVPFRKNYQIRVMNLLQSKNFHSVSNEKILRNPNILLSYIKKDDATYQKISIKREKLLLAIKENDYNNSVRLFNEILSLFEKASVHFIIIFSLGLQLMENANVLKDVGGIIKKHDIWRNSVAFKEEAMEKDISHFFEYLLLKRKLNINPELLIKFLTAEEINRWLKKELADIEIEKKIKARKNKDFVYLNLKDIDQEVVDNAIEIGKIQRYFLKLEQESKKSEKENEISGQVAYSPKKLVKGKVVIIKDRFELKTKNHLIDGKILVSIQTTPHFIPYVKKAKAIITDEGGWTSHAAIIAREFSIPCIVGTKTATQILKDGDFVEVDTDNGTVRIIKK